MCGSYSFKASPGGWPLFVLDTRTHRESWHPKDNTSPAIVSAGDMQALLQWLVDHQKLDPQGPKFVATPSVILPLERTLKTEPRWSSDGWAGFPASRDKLLAWIAVEGIRNVVFLSGDAHLSMFSKGEIEAPGKPKVPVLSIVSSGLYAPWRFANADAVCYQQGPQDLNGTSLNGHLVTKFFEANGFAVISVACSGNGYELTAEFDLADGLHAETVTLT